MAPRCRPPVAGARTTLLILAHAVLGATSSTSMGPVLFLNFLRHELELRWDDGTVEGVLLGRAPAMGDASVGRTFTGHVFRLVRAEGAPEERRGVAAEFRMQHGVHAYVAGPEPGDSEALKHPRYLRYLKEQEVSKYERALGGHHERGELQAVRFIRPTAAPEKDIAMGVIFKNFGRKPVSLYWDNGTEPGAYSGEVPAMGTTTSLASFPGHVFKLMHRKEDGEFELVKRHTIHRDKRVYVLEPAAEDMSHPSYLQHLEVSRHADEYLNRTGTVWLGSYPPRPPTVHMHEPGTQLGELKHSVIVRKHRQPGAPAAFGTMDLVSLAWWPHGPRLFLLEGLLDREECEHVAALAEGKLYAGRIGGAQGFASKARTSKVAFLQRSASPMLEAIHERFADVLNVSDSELRTLAESLQVVKYEKGEQYAPHYDYTSSAGTRRLTTLLVYLDPAEDGGGTSFPRAFGERGLELRPKQGDAILFYSQLPDGNLDELSLHAGTPVVSGVKRVCNLWVHSHGNWDAQHSSTAEKRQAQGSGEL